MSIVDKIYEILEQLYQKGELPMLPETLAGYLEGEGKREALYEASRKAMGVSLDVPIVEVECKYAMDVDCERCGREIGLPMRHVYVSLGNVAGEFCAGYDEKEGVVKVTRARFCLPRRR